ncbi:MAG: YdcF family protein [Hyphomicrobium sp.]|nr:YdcF family protein [Hyphomicrobium sp.]
MLRDLGVDDTHLLLDRRARNTSENALFAKQLADPRPGERWLLVTSAWHMPRAMGLFRKAGFNVEAWPSDYRTAGPADAWLLFDSPAEGLRRLDFAVKEWLGLLLNRVSGRSDALLPAP